MTFDDYMDNLQNACGMAVRAIGRYFGKFKSGSKEFRWFQTTPQYPAFQHLGFRFKNQVYSVLIAMVDTDGSIIVDPQFVSLQKQACKDYNLVPCMILIKGDSIVSLFPSAPFPLISTYYLDGRNENVSPHAMDLDERIDMSDWEINSLGIWVVRNQLFNEKAEILSYCDYLEVSPSIWYEKDGKKNMVYTKVFGPDGMVGSFPREMTPVQKRKLAPFGCYYAEITLVPDPGDRLIRGEGFRIKYSGLEPFDLNTLADGKRDYIARSDID